MLLLFFYYIQNVFILLCRQVSDSNLLTKTLNSKHYHHVSKIPYKNVGNLNN